MLVFDSHSLGHQAVNRNYLHACEKRRILCNQALNMATTVYTEGHIRNALFIPMVCSALLCLTSRCWGLYWWNSWHFSWQVIWEFCVLLAVFFWLLCWTAELGYTGSLMNHSLIVSYWFTRQWITTTYMCAWRETFYVTKQWIWLPQ